MSLSENHIVVVWVRIPVSDLIPAVAYLLFAHKVERVDAWMNIMGCHPTAIHTMKFEFSIRFCIFWNLSFFIPEMTGGNKLKERCRGVGFQRGAVE